MRIWPRLIVYILLNIIVSALTMFLVLRWWESRNTPEASAGTPVVILVTTTPQDTLAVDVLPIVEKSAPETPQPTADPLLPTATIEVIVYYVKAGDTLGIIAAAYEVSLADILAVNEIDNPDQLFVGQKLFIPAGPLPTQAPLVTATQTITPTLTATLPATASPQPSATVTPQGQPAGMQIITVIGAGDLDNEHVLLKRTGSGELPLAGWQLADQDGNVYTFPRLTLYQDGAVNVYTRLGQNTVVDLYWGFSAPVWQPGETVTLYDDQGDVRASFTIP
jgi:LysM repeat protein